MFINYKETNCHAMADLTTHPGQVHQGPQNIHWLRPGWNEFPKHVWEMNFKTSKILQRMVRKGKIEFLNEKVTFTVIDKKTGKKKKVTRVMGADDREVKIKRLDEKRAIQIVKGTLNRDILQRWLDEEYRHKVKRALAKQIEPLMPSDEDRKSNDRDDDEDND